MVKKHGVNLWHLPNFMIWWDFMFFHWVFEHMWYWLRSLKSNRIFLILSIVRNHSTSEREHVKNFCWSLTTMYIFYFLSCYIFVLFAIHLTCRSSSSFTLHMYLQQHPKPQIILLLLHVNDVVLFSINADGMQCLLEAIEALIQSSRLNMNVVKNINWW